MYGRGPAQSGISVLVVLGASHHVLTGGSVLVAGIFVAEVAAVVVFSNDKSVGPALGAPGRKFLWDA